MAANLAMNAHRWKGEGLHDQQWIAERSRVKR
jgi:hypothetical protein